MTNGFEGPNKLPRPFGPFTLVRLIAQGGMGQVYLALRPVEGESTDEVCVVKTVRADLKHDREAIGRFLDEARVAQKLDHPAICHTLDAGITEKTYFLALEFISGRNLRDVQTRAQKLNLKLPDELIFHSIGEMLVALDYAHSLVDTDSGRPLNIVHRDVSPHNVMLGFDGNVKLIDFGLATHVLKREFTRPGIMVGKLRYNAPEQVRDRAMDGRSDLYSVGVMLYEALTGERFYEGLAEEGVWRVAMEGNHRPPSWDTLPRDAQSVLELALSGEPQDRYPSAAHMREAVLELARSRGVRDGRKEAARFMAEVFADERVAERDMILQATGLAEARTRLFAPQPLHTRDGAEVSHSSVGRTAVVTPAELRGKLADLVSSFDPGAQTAMPQRPIFADDLDEPTGNNPPETDVDPDVSGFRSSGRNEAAPPRTRADAATIVRKPKSAFGPEVSDTEAAPDHTTPGLPRNVSMPGVQRPSSHSNSGRNAPSAPSRSRATRSVDGPAGRDDLPPLRSGPSRAVVVLSIAVVVLLIAIGVITWALIQKMNEGARAADAGVALEAADAGGGAASDADAGGIAAASVDAGGVAVIAAADAGFAAPDPAPVDAGFQSAPAVVDAGPRGRTLKRPPPDRTPDRTPDKNDKPPQRDFRTLKEQVDYLKQYCVERVSCAKPTIDKAASIAQLSPDETKALIADIPRCISRCQKSD